MEPVIVNIAEFKIYITPIMAFTSDGSPTEFLLNSVFSMLSTLSASETRMTPALFDAWLSVTIVYFNCTLDYCKTSKNEASVT